jgi:hypothetical protein
MGREVNQGIKATNAKIIWEPLIANTETQKVHQAAIAKTSTFCHFKIFVL